MTITKLHVDTSELSAPVPVPEPLGLPIATVCSRAVPSEANLRTRAGVWECTPGRFQRQVTQAEFCHFIEGECTFTPDGQDAIEIRPGVALFFPPNTKGVWEVHKTTRKVFIVFDESTPV
jgi:uncharacterized cupin superfamily protein